MRLVGDISHPSLKITIFLHDSKYAVKFEAGLYEQTYKFRTSDSLQSVEDIKAMIDAAFIEEVRLLIPKMHQHKMEAIGRSLSNSPQEEEFEEII